MTDANPNTIQLAAQGGADFLAYRTPTGSLTLERIRRSGRRDANSIFSFDFDVLRGAIDRLRGNGE